MNMVYNHPLPYIMGAQGPILKKKETYTPYVVGAQRPILTQKETYTPYIVGAGAT